MKLYLAYGANTNFTNMNNRCPGAQYVCNVTLKDHRLVFRGVADVVPAKGAQVTCAMWLITPEDEKALDAFEGFPRLYVKRYITLRLSGKRHRAMLYVMRVPRGESEPYPSYEACLREGYEQCGMPQAQLDEAVKRAKRSTKQHATKSSWATKKPVDDPAANEAAMEDAYESDLFNNDDDYKEFA